MKNLKIGDKIQWGNDWKNLTAATFIAYEPCGKMIITSMFGLGYEHGGDFTVIHLDPSNYIVSAFKESNNCRKIEKLEVEICRLELKNMEALNNLKGKIRDLNNL